MNEKMNDEQMKWENLETYFISFLSKLFIKKKKHKTILKHRKQQSQRYKKTDKVFKREHTMGTTQKWFH